MLRAGRRLRRSVVLISATAVALGVIGVAAWESEASRPAGGSNKDVAGHSNPSEVSRYGTTCETWVVAIKDPPGSADVPVGYEGHARCSVIPTGVQVRVRMDTFMYSVESDWVGTAGQEFSTTWVSSHGGAQLDYRADPSGRGSRCRSWLKTEHVPWMYDKSRVVASCDLIAPHVKVRGVLDVTAHADKHTEYFTTTNREYWSDSVQLSEAQIRGTRLEYGLQ